MSVRRANPIIWKIRDFLLQRLIIMGRSDHSDDPVPFPHTITRLLSTGKRKFEPCLRYEEQIAPRTQPLPDLPDGPSHKLATNDYCTRDGRRDCLPPEVVYTGHQSALAPGQAIESGQSGEPAMKPVKAVSPPSMPHA